MTARWIVAVDEGTTGVRAIVVDEAGKVAGQAYREVGASYPRPGYVEQDPEALRDGSVQVAREALSRAAVAPGAVAALGITCQRSTAVAWSRKTGRPLHAALSWQDLRTAERCAELAAQGHFVTPFAAASKLEWMIRSVPAVRAAAASGDLLCGTLDAWLAWSLSGGACHVTDASNAATSGLYDFFGQRWNEALVSELGIPMSALPVIRASSERYGATDAGAFGVAMPIAGIAGDQQAAMFGQACFAAGGMKASYGTSAMIDLNAGHTPLLSSHGAFPLVLWKLGEETTYCLEGTAITAGASVQWLRDGLGVLASAEESAALASSVPDAGGAWFVPALQGLGTPYLDTTARAAIGGLSRGTTRAHVVRAVLEGVAHRCAEIVEALAADAGSPLPSALRADGGAAANDFLLQFQSDLLGVPVERPEMLDAAASGAAFLAGLAVGVWPDLASLERTWRLGRRFEPRMSSDERADRRGRFHRAVAAVREVGS